jgi:hypothetical protein
MCSVQTCRLNGLQKKKKDERKKAEKRRKENNYTVRQEYKTYGLAYRFMCSLALLEQ